ncbi:MAG: Type 1 glutamine amidotransferase-like domain-containing protein [Pseudomonadota bacterium]
MRPVISDPTMLTPAFAVLGPQQHIPNLAATLDELGIDGPVCAVTAGWQEREGELDDLIGHIDRPCVDLGLYQTANDVFAEDPSLFHAHRARQDKLRLLQSLYRKRLDHAHAAAAEMLAAEGDSSVVLRERRAAINALRSLDRQHLVHIEDVHRDFDQTFDTRQHPRVAHARERIARQLADASAVLVAGGHVSTLVGRLRLFAMASLLEDKTIVAWSAGAMALSRRIVLFHDSPPQGPGHAEVFDAGLNLLPAILPLPHARERLRLDDVDRVALMARRFGPDPAITLDAGARAIGDRRGWNRFEGCARLNARGTVSALSESDA